VDAEDVLADLMERTVAVGTISFLAFTTAPKGKTAELFGREDATGLKREFDPYSMKQPFRRASSSTC